MRFSEREFLPLLLGGDINTYSVARAFYESYGVKSVVIGKYPTGPSYQSRITDYTADEAIDTDKVFLERVNRYAAEHTDKKVLLIGCGDSYVSLISRHKAELAENIIAPYIEHRLMNELQIKERFYKLCERHGLDYPDTFVYSREMGGDFEHGLSYPLILKPSNGIRYWENSFATQHKVYTIHDRQELLSVISDIYGAGYDDKLILQDMIPGNDEYMRVLTAYSDSAAKVKMLCLGHVLLEEHTPHGLGNHAVIITQPGRELATRVKALLEDLRYTGFSNFDIKYDRRDGRYKFFEINTRQGRSNYYVTASGLNIAEFLVEDHVYGRELTPELSGRENLWMVVPRRVAFRYVKNPDLKARMKRLIRRGRVVNPVFLKGDNHPLRMARMIKNHFRQYVNYRKYYS